MGADWPFLRYAVAGAFAIAIVLWRPAQQKTPGIAWGGGLMGVIRRRAYPHRPERSYQLAPAIRRRNYNAAHRPGKS